MLGAATLQLGDTKMYNCNASTSSNSTLASSRIDNSPPTGSTAILHQFQHNNVPHLYLNARIPPTQNLYNTADSVKIESEVSPQNDDDTGSNSDGDDGAGGYGEGGDAEGVWSADIEQAFQEALAVYPPCGRRKIILQEEGKMYGRNELIARYIKIRTNKTRTRKQVSSHIQVLARKKQREFKELSKPSVDESGGAGRAQTKTRSDCFTPPHKKSKAVKKEAESGATFASSSLQLNSSLPAVANMTALGTTGASAFMPPASLTTSQQNAALLNQFIINQQIASSSLPLGFPSIPFSFNNGGFLSGSAQAPLPFAGGALLPTQLAPTSVPCITAPNMSLIKFVAYVEDAAERKRHDLVRVDIDAMYDVDDPNKTGNRSEAIKLDEFDVTNNLIKTHFKNDNDQLDEIMRSSSDAAQSCFIAKCWGTVDYQSNSSNLIFAYDARYETNEPYQIEISTRVISCGRRILEKVEREKPTFCADSKKYIYEIEQSGMCDYIKKFLEELKKLKNIKDMDAVLELLTILHVVSGKLQGSSESKVLLCIAFFFKMSPADSLTPTVTRVFKIVDAARST